MTTHPTLPRILCIGVDVTWWGGGRNRASQGETIVSATLDDPALSIERIDLAEHPNPRRQLPTEPNCDADGVALCSAILDTIGRHPGVDYVIVAFDAPLVCCERPDQPARRKAVAEGESMGTRQRGAERALRRYMNGLAPELRAAWNQGLWIRAGSPIPCRIARVVERLRAAQLPLYLAGGAAPPLGLVEVFIRRAHIGDRPRL